jgi:hypothetical protein
VNTSPIASAATSAVVIDNSIVAPLANLSIPA